MTQRSKARVVRATTLGDGKDEHVDHATLVGAVLTQTATVTTDPDTFAVSQTFDLGGPCVYNWVVTLLAFDPDGEAVGVEDGQIAVDIQTSSISFDGVTWRTMPAGDWFHDNPAGMDDFAMGAASFTPRYLRLTNIRVVGGFSLDPYDGANHPSATARIDVSYR